VVKARRSRPPLEAVPEPQEPRPGTGPARGGVESQLLQQVAQGDRQAFAQLYDLTSPKVFGLIRSVVRDRAMAEEVTQEVFLQVWKQAPRFRPDMGSAPAWISTVAHRRAVDRVRSEEASRARLQRDQRMDMTSAPGPESAILDQVDRQRVRAALAQLTERQRRAIELAYYGGHTYEEVAVLLDIPAGTAKTRIRDGLIRLRDALGVGDE
jgi:RNA polymerase sigma-70 factor (ECF subfamily)